MGPALSILLGTTLCVITSGLAVAHLFHALGRPYLCLVYGTRPRLALVRTAVWMTAGISALAAWMIASRLLPESIAIAIFFAVVTVLLDICGHRVRYIAMRTYPSAHRLVQSGQQPSHI